MVKRNIVQQGPSTLMVSLPFRWVKKYNLKKGEQIDLEEKGNNLIISTEKTITAKFKEIKLLHSQYYYIWTEISAAYLSGFDEIKIIFHSEDDFKFIENEALKAMMGFEIIEQTSKYCILKKIFAENGDEFNTIVRRVFLGLIETSNEFKKVLKGESNGKFILPFERTNNRQTYYLRRLVVKEEIENKDKTTFVSTLTFLLEQLMNQYKYASWSLEQENFPKIRKEIIELFEKVHYKLEKLYELYFNYSQKKFQKFELETIKPKSKEGDMINELKIDPLITHYLIDMTEKMRYISYQIHGINS